MTATINRSSSILRVTILTIFALLALLFAGQAKAQGHEAWPNYVEWQDANRTSGIPDTESKDFFYFPNLDEARYFCDIIDDLCEAEEVGGCPDQQQVDAAKAACVDLVREGTMFEPLLNVMKTAAMRREEGTVEILPVTVIIVGTDLAGKPSAPKRFTLTASGMTKYLGANGSVFHNHPVGQPDLFILLPWWGLSFDTWISRSNGSMNEGFGNEVDFTLAKSGERYEIGIAYFAVNEVPADVIQLYLKLGESIDTTKRSIVPYVWIEHYLATKGNDPGRGSFLRVGFQQKSSWMTIDNVGWSLKQRLGVFYDTGAFGFAEGTLAEWNGKLLYTLKSGLSLGPTVKCATPISLSHRDGRGTDCAVGLMATTSF